MPDKVQIPIEDLLKNPDVQRATNNTNPELIERRQNMPPRCDVFTKPYTELRNAEGFKFAVDLEAKKQLPGIINNTVQTIVGLDSVEESFKEEYCKKQNIGIVYFKIVANYYLISS